MATEAQASRVTQREDTCPDCGATRTELVVAPGRFYCPPCGLAGPGPNQSAVPGAQLDLFHQPIEPATAPASEPIADDEPEPQPPAWMHCLQCGHIGDDVMYGSCAACFKAASGEAA